MDPLASKPKSEVESEACSDTAAPSPTIWAIGGGKGGVGKSLVSSSLAVATARRGHRTVLVDLDLGAANAHSLLGMRPPSHSLSDFASRRVEHLSELMEPTPVPGLSLIGSARASLDLANLKYAQKARLLRQLRTLDADHVFLDLGAGTTYNVLDFFLVAHHRIAVLIPEATALENTQHFLKAAFFRSLRHVARREPARTAIELALEGNPSAFRSARALLERVQQIDAEAGRLLTKQALAFAPVLVVNQLSPHANPDTAAQIALACRHFLAAGARERGRLPRDERVRDAVAKKVHPLEAFPASAFCLAVEKLAEELLDGDHGTPHEPAPCQEEILARTAALEPYREGRPGAYLRTCRERLGFDLEEMRRRTRIRCLEHLENERFDSMPGPTYVAAFVRQYAELLGVPDAEALTDHYVEAFRASTGGPGPVAGATPEPDLPEAAADETPEPAPRRKRRSILDLGVWLPRRKR